MTTTFETDGQGRTIIDKDPESVLDYSFDWTDWLDEVPGDYLVSQVTTPDGITLDASSISGTKIVVCWFSGGVLGETPSATCHIVTHQGREEDKTIYFNMLSK